MNSPSPLRPTLLLVEDDPQLLPLLVRYFELSGYDVTAANTIAEAKAIFQQQKTWTLVISDYHLPDGNGWDFCCWVREQPRVSPPLILMSGEFSGEPPAGVEFLSKPFEIAELQAKVTGLARRAQPGPRAPNEA